jgi:hypothetical protein
MADSSIQQPEIPDAVSSESDSETLPQDMGDVRIEERDEAETPVLPVPKETLEAKVPVPRKGTSRAGTTEHLAARRPVPAINVDAPAFKERLSALRSELTALLTDYRWGGASTEQTANALIPLLNVGPLQQWIPVLIPFLLEIDRAGNFVPVWFNVIDREEHEPLAEHMHPFETTLGKAQRIAILMLGQYKAPDISKALGKLAVDPNLSLYATQSLVKQATVGALQALLTALKEAEGWAKVDIVEACLTLNLTRLYEMLLASGLDHAPGLESYIAVPIYRVLPLERYLRGGEGIAPRLSQQAALIFAQVIQDSSQTRPTSDALPIVFERDLHNLAIALFEGTRALPDWQHVVSLHQLAVLLGQLWAAIARGDLKDSRIIEPVYACLSLMPDIERWMNGPGRDILLQTLKHADQTDASAFKLAARVLGDVGEPRAFAVLAAYVESIETLPEREQAMQLGQALDTLGRLGDRRSAPLIAQLIARIVNTDERSARSRRQENLSDGDPDIPGSIVLASALRAFGQLQDSAMLDVVLRAARDFDPYVRKEAIEALKSIDAKGDDERSRFAMREALNDPNDAVVRVAMQLVAHYHDTDATSSLQLIEQERPALAASALQALRALGGYSV